VSASLLKRLRRLRGRGKPAGRLAPADTLLAVIALGMLVSGLWDWYAGHPARIRWHALTGVALAVVIVIHAARRRSRLRRSDIR
jgi:hypothetical protein